MTLHNHKPQLTGRYENSFDYGDALKGYTSDGGSIRINRDLASFMLITATAKRPNKAILQARKDAFKHVTKEAQTLLEKQREAYELQRMEIAQQHQSHMEAMRKQNEMLQEDVRKVREEYLKAFQSEAPDEVRDVKESRALLMHIAMSNSLKNQVRRHKGDYESEKKRRQQKEDELREAEAKIAELKEELSLME